MKIKNWRKIVLNTDLWKTVDEGTETHRVVVSNKKNNVQI
jgi:hypothetical protein